MRKLFIVIMMMFLVTGCTHEEELNQHQTDLMNFEENTNFDLELTQVVDDDILAQYIKVDHFGGYTLFEDPELIEYAVVAGEQNYVEVTETTSYGISGYPDVLDEQKFVTYIHTCDPDKVVFGYSVNDDVVLEDLKEEMLGFDFDLRNETEHTISFENEAYWISFSLNQNEITTIRISVHVTNEEGAQF